MIKISLPEVEGNILEFMGVTQERQIDILEEMKKAIVAMQKEVYPEESMRNDRVVRGLLERIPLETPNEVFFLGMTCGRMFSVVPGEPDPLDQLFRTVINR